MNAKHSKEPTRGVGGESGGATVALDRRSAEAGTHIPLSPDELSIEEQRALAAKVFPQEWARALTQTGTRGQKARATWRKRAVNEAKLIPLRAAGRSCASCKHFGRVPVSNDRCCDLESDFHGYAITTATGLCADWAARTVGGSASPQTSGPASDRNPS